MDCIFCKILNREISSDIIYEDDKILVFKDLYPQAPIHLLAIPKTHIPSLNSINKENSLFIAKIFEVIPIIAEKLAISESYRVVNNCGNDAGQTVQHVHFHILGGRKMLWPPG